MYDLLGSTQRLEPNMARSTIKFGLFSLVATAHADSVVHWDLPSTADNTQAVAQGYLGFGIEMKSFPDFAGKLHFVIISVSRPSAVC